MEMQVEGSQSLKSELFLKQPSMYILWKGTADQNWFSVLVSFYGLLVYMWISWPGAQKAHLFTFCNEMALDLTLAYVYIDPGESNIFVNPHLRLKTTV